MSIQVNPDLNVTVRAPRLASQKDIEYIIKEKEAWISKHIEQIKVKKAQYESMPINYLTNEEIKELADKALLLGTIKRQVFACVGQNTTKKSMTGL